MPSDPVTAAVALGAGVASFFSPCVLPVVPGILAVVLGDEASTWQRRLATTGAFVAGFGVAFVVVGLAVGALGTAAIATGLDEWIQRIGGAVVIAFGLHLVGLLKIPGLDREARADVDVPEGTGRMAAAGLVGAAFGVGWTPCVGPILASILVVAGVQGGIAQGGLLLGLYAVGLGVPFLVVGAAGHRGAEMLRGSGRAADVLQRVGGVALIALGIFVFTGELARITSYL